VVVVAAELAPVRWRIGDEDHRLLGVAPVHASERKPKCAHAVRLDGREEADQNVDVGREVTDLVD
jgi:hypothetical protein